MDRSIANSSALLQDVQERLRDPKSEDIDSLIARYLRDEHAGPLLFKPLQPYNEFASFFRCGSHANPLSWQHDLELNDGSRLRLHGINSVLVSNARDDSQPRRLVAGTVQARPSEEPGVTYLSLCHHPPEWFRDYDKVTNSLNNRVKIQLFGHKHFQRIDKINNSLRLGAGAVHPDRKEANWLPRYNWISLHTYRNKAGRFLEAKVYSRSWSEDKTAFLPDRTESGGDEYSSHTLPLDDWSVPVVSPSITLASQGSQLPPTCVVSPTTSVTVTPMDKASAARSLTYRFLELPHVSRIAIAQALGLYRNEDEGLVDAELFERIFDRAAKGRCLEKLWLDVHEYRGNREQTNPYMGR